MGYGGGLILSDKNLDGKPLYHVVNFSGGKDSTAMLLRMIELDMPIDEILFCDTGLEFPEIYEHIDKVEKYIGRKITRLKHDKSFEYYLTEHEYIIRQGKHKGQKIKGYSFPGPLSRWCTKAFKINMLDKYFRHKQKEYNIIRNIGIAYDEQKRIKEYCYPLVDWKWTEADCLKYCYDKGFDWGGLYNYFSRVSCWCCPLQAIHDLKMLWKHFPHLWKKLQEWQDRTWGNFNRGKRLSYYEERFKFEEEWEKQGKQIGRNKEFQKALKEHLAKEVLISPSQKSCKDIAIEYFKNNDKFDKDIFLSIIKHNVRKG